MPLAALRQYLERLPERQSEWRLMLIEAASFPYQAESARRKLLRQLQAQPVIHQPTPEQLALAGIGVEWVKRPPG